MNLNMPRENSFGGISFFGGGINETESPLRANLVHNDPRQTF